ncbi:MAG TPA: oligosaccharide flippase family protein [Polyangiaceae bacterium]|nr:oligosaccharide flippase family protein [Polyangiaceae bacterium]
MSEALTTEPKSQGANRRLVVKNTLYLTFSQVVTVPLSVLVNAVTARYLGAEIFGYLYLAGTFAGFGMLAVGWGHEGVLPAMVARDRSLAGVLLGSSFVWRAGSAIVVYAVLATLCALLGYGSELQWALVLTFVAAVFNGVVGACKDAIRGFERADIPAIAHVGQLVLSSALVVPAVLLGGRMRTVLVLGLVTVIIVFLFMLRTLKAVGVGKLSVQKSALKSLFFGGTPFVVFNLALALQPFIDGIYLSKLGSVEAVGWYSVARKLIGLLIFPATALIGALYPTLCRLWSEDQEEFRTVARGSLLSIALLVVPVVLGCGLYPDVGIAIFSKQAYGPAADDLRVLAGFLFLVYFSMPLGTIVLAAGKQRAWSIVQSLCIVVSFALDPFLTPWFESRYHNGGLGPCVAAVVSEAIVVGCGIVLAPAGVFNAKLWRTLFFAALAGGAMAVVAWLLRALNPFLASPVALLAYGAALVATGEINRSHFERVRGIVMRKLSRAR